MKRKIIFLDIDGVLNSNVDSWIVIDDLDLNDEEIIKHQVRPDSIKGLTKDDALCACTLFDEIRC